MGVSSRTYDRNMKEEWRPVPGFEGIYEASNHGGVRSLSRVIMRRNGKAQPLRGVQMSPAMGTSGHLQVTLNRGPGFPSRLFGVHQLVMLAFVGPPPEGMEVCHRNGIGTDNRLENLRYGTRSENVDDSVQHGTHPQARKTHCPQGHEYTPENTRLKPHAGGGMGRHCKQCELAYQRRRYARRRQANAA